MEDLKGILLKKRENLEKILDGCKERLENAPQGTLRVTNTKKFTQFYQTIAEENTRKYISKSDKELISKLAQKSYDKNILLLVEKRLNQINKFLKDYEDDEI
jgi:hypothetical protein